MTTPKLPLEQAYDLALKHHEAGRLPEAEALYRQILAQQPRHAVALELLGVIAHQVGKNDVAVDLIRQAIALEPNFPEAFNNLSVALKELGRFPEAIAACRQAITVYPKYTSAYNNLGNVLKDTGQLNDAVAAYRQALTFEPNNTSAHLNLGNALKDQGRIDEAIASYRRVLALSPDYAEAYSNLGAALQTKGDLDEAIAAFHRSIALSPRFPDSYNNLGVALKDQAQLDEAIAAYRQALALNPTLADVHSNLIFTMHCHPAYDALAIAAEYRRWNHQHAEPLKQFIRPFSNNRSPDRRLRIGYVSPDLREHPVGWFLLPLLANHDRQRFEVFCYAQSPASDAFTQRLRSHTDAWRSIVGVSDMQAADLIRQDHIDILVDLAMHTAGNRLLLFAHKPAPVQACYLAYCSSTGLATMDYRLSDPYLDPPGADDSLYTEQTLRLPETYWCYQPTLTVPEVGPLPSLAQGRVTFASLNNFCKVSEATLATWGKLLRAVPSAQLVLHSCAGSHRQKLHEWMAQDGIDVSRVQLVGKMPLADYFRLYQRIDIALDTFPYGGGTTTCDALWMGVPVVSLRGQTAVGRGGLSILSNVGLPELVGQSEDEYVHIAQALAEDLPRLTHLRATLRNRMQQSPLMDAQRFARNVEAAYRQMWAAYCAPPAPR